MVRKSQADDDEDDTSHGAHCEKIMNSLKKPIFIDVQENKYWKFDPTQ